MKLAPWEIPANLRGRSDEMDALLLSLKKRDEEIEDALNSNAHWSSTISNDLIHGGRPEHATATISGATVQTLLEGPPDGTSRLVNLVGLCNADAIARLLYLYMEDGTDTFNLYFSLAQAAFTTYNFLEGGPGPFVMEHGDSLKVVSTAAVVWAEPLIVAHYTDDTSGRWHRGAVEVGDAAYTVVVPEPPANTRRLIPLVQCQNRDDVTHSIFIGIRDTTTAGVWWWDSELNAAAGGYFTYPGQGNAYVLRPGFEMITLYATATNLRESYMTAHYFDAMEDASGEG